MEAYIRNMGHAVLSLRRNFSVNTDRWAAAVVAIDQLPRKIAGVTDTKVEKNAMSEDKINEEEGAATQTVAKAPVDDAIGEKAPREIRKSQDEDDASIASQKLARGDNSHMPSETDTNATKRGYGPFHGNSSNWPASPKRPAPAGQAPPELRANAPKKGKSAPDASSGVQTPKKDDAPSKQSDRDGSPPPMAVEAEVEVDGRANSDDEEPRKDDAIDPIVDPAGEDTDVEDSHEVAHQYFKSPDDPFKERDMVFAKVGRTWYAGSIYKRYPSGGDGDFVYDVHTYAERKLENVPKRRLLLFTKEEFERMFARMKNWRRAGAARLCLYLAACEFNCNCACPEDWIDTKRPGLHKESGLVVTKDVINRVCSTPWCKDLVKRFKAAQLKRRESVEGTRP